MGPSHISEHRRSCLKKSNGWRQKITWIFKVDEYSTTGFENNLLLISYFQRQRLSVTSRVASPALHGWKGATAIWTLLWEQGEETQNHQQPELWAVHGSDWAQPLCQSLAHHHLMPAEGLITPRPAATATRKHWTSVTPYGWKCCIRNRMGWADGGNAIGRPRCARWRSTALMAVGQVSLEEAQSPAPAILSPPPQLPEPLIISGGRQPTVQQDEPGRLFHRENTTARGRSKWSDLDQTDHLSCFCSPSMTD